MTDPNWRLVQRIADAAEKLLMETTRLRGDVMRLHGRIEPFEGERTVHDLNLNYSKPKNLKDALGLLSDSREAIIDCEHHLSAIRGAVDGIASDAISRAEMKPWLKGRGD